MIQQLSSSSNQNLTKPESHWTERSTADFVSRITFDFSTQVQQILDTNNETQAALAKKLNLTDGRVSQVLNSPSSMGLKTIVKYARAIGRKVAIVLYDDGDRDNLNGPVNSEIFSTCWERLKKPHDFFELETAKTTDNIRLIIVSSVAIHGSAWNCVPPVSYSASTCNGTLAKLTTSGQVHSALLTV